MLTTIFVDYDNIYLSLRRKSEEAAKRFAKDASLWLRELESGRLITATNGISPSLPRRIVMNRCYGNPVPRRNNSDNSTDMNSFPFVRHHFLRSGFEVIDCPPLTAQLKNSSDIRMVMDVRDLLGHDTYFDEFIILSGDADFTPVLHRLRAHARRTVIFANDHTAAPYTSISDGEVRESDLIALLLDGRIAGEAEPNSLIDSGVAGERAPSITQIEILRRELVGEVAALVRQAGQPVPLEALADRLVRTLGHDKTVGSGWGGTGSFRDLLSRALPGELRLSGEPPYYVYDAALKAADAAQLGAPAAAAEIPVRLNYAEPRIEQRPETRLEPRIEHRYEAALQPAQRLAPAAQSAAPQTANPVRPAAQAPLGQPQPSYAQPAAPIASTPLQSQAAAKPAPAQQPIPRTPMPQQSFAAPASHSAPQAAPQTATQLQQSARTADAANAIQQSIARIHEACQAPPLSPPEYRALFEAIAQEINSNGLMGAQTLVNIGKRANELGIDVRRDDIRFVLEVVSEADPWFEQGASAALFSSRFRNFVVARCRSQGLNLSSDELDLIEAWFAGAGSAAGSGDRRPAAQQSAAASQIAPQRAPVVEQQPQPAAATGDRWWGLDEGRQHVADTRAERFGQPPDGGDEFPRFVRKGLRG